MNFKKTWTIIKQTFEDFFSSRIFKLSAALAYYTLFSIPGLIIVVMWIGDDFFGLGKSAMEGRLYPQIASLVGSQASAQIQETVKNATLFPDKGISTMIGLITLIFGATSMFAEIQDSINMIWRLKAKPKKGKGWVKLIMDRLLSFSMVLTIGFLMLVSLLLNIMMDFVVTQLTNLTHIERALPQSEVVIAYISNLVLTFLFTSILFGLIFKLLPDARIKWRTVRAGAFVTAILFMLGKFLISYYLGNNRMSTAYGAAGSVIIILLWVYYSAVILYFGATFTRVFAINNGMNIYPSQFAVWVEQVEVENKDSIQTLTNDPIVAKSNEEQKENIVNDGYTPAGVQSDEKKQD